MKYTQFSLYNYKGIPNIELDLSKKPQTNIFTLVGLNESGKTSILEAINLFYDDILKKNAHELIPKNKQYSFDGEVSICAYLHLDELDIRKIEKFLIKNYGFEISNKEDLEKISITKSYRFKESAPDPKKWKNTTYDLPIKGKSKRAKHEKLLSSWNNNAWQELVKMINSSMLPKILYYPDFLFKFPEKIYLEEHANEGEEQPEYRNVLQDILNAIGEENDQVLFLESVLLERMKNSSNSADLQALNQILLKISDKLENDVLKKWDDIFQSGQQKEVKIDWGSDDREDSTYYFLKIEIKQGSTAYSINDRSLGFRWFFSFLIFTAFRKVRSNDPGETLFLLDEPASNLHQSSQQKLLESLNSIVSDCKLIYSTHSHHLINPRWLAGTYIVRNKAIDYSNPEVHDAQDTDIEALLYKNFVAQHPNEEDHFKPVLDALGYTPSQLELVPSIIFTEGKNDYYTFKYINEVVLNNKYELHFYPGSGKDSYYDVIRLYLAWNKPFLAIFDGDKGGKQSKNKYKKAIGVDLENRVFTLDDVDKKFDNLETEYLFTETEQLKIIQTSFPSHKKEDGYDKSKFNTAIQQLYIDGESFNLNKTTINKFERIFRFITTNIEV